MYISQFNGLCILLGLLFFSVSMLIYMIVTDKKLRSLIKQLIP
jgi:hypothetical protein